MTDEAKKPHDPLTEPRPSGEPPFWLKPFDSALCARIMTLLRRREHDRIRHRDNRPD